VHLNMPCLYFCIIDVQYDGEGRADSGPCKCKRLLTCLLRASGGRPIGNVAGPSQWRETRGQDE
jgi:hypothetical protein